MYLNGSEFALSKLKMHYKLLLLAILLFIAPQALSKRKPARKCPGESSILSRLPCFRGGGREGEGAGLSQAITKCLWTHVANAIISVYWRVFDKESTLIVIM